MFTRLLLSYYRLIAVDLSRQKELDTDPKTNHQIEFVRQLKKLDMMVMVQIQLMIKLCLS